MTGRPEGAPKPITLVAERAYSETPFEIPDAMANEVTAAEVAAYEDE